MEQYTFAKASEYLGLPKKFLENYAKIGGELVFAKKGRAYVIDQEELDRWTALRNYRTVSLEIEDYIQCLEFALRSFYAYTSTSDFGTATQRGAGKFVDNFTSGKLGEIAVRKFLKDKTGIDIKLDFALRDAVVGQDITEVSKPRRGPRVYNPPRLRVSIKTTKLKNVWLIVPQSELDDPARASDIYVLARVELSLDHAFRFLKGHALLENITDIIPEFEPLAAEVVGFVWKDELSAKDPVSEIPGQAIKPSYILPSGELRCSDDEWKDFVSRL